MQVRQVLCFPLATHVSAKNEICVEKLVLILVNDNGDPFNVVYVRRHLQFMLEKYQKLHRSLCSNMTNVTSFQGATFLACH